MAKKLSAFYLEPTQLTLLAEAAQARRLPQGELVRRAIEAYLKRQSKKRPHSPEAP